MFQTGIDPYLFYSSEYEILKSQSDPERYPINKIRKCFIYKDRYFQLDYYKSPNKGLVMLEGYLDAESDFHSFIPTFLDVVDVTNDKKYSMYNLSLISKSQ